jgi:1-acyl-sn-glycerol-3-phosphate acyltransferase
MSAAERRDEHYPLPKSLMLRFAFSVILGRRRELGRDVKVALARARPRPRVVDEQYIPESGPFVFVANHYERPGVKVWWGGMLATSAIYDRRSPEAGRTLYWLMTSEWYNFRLGGIIPVPVWLLRWLFRRIANAYNLVIVPRSPERVAGRAASMRAILDVVSGRGQPIGMYPEGIGEDVLREAMPGTGAFLHSLSKRGVPILPAGVYEEDGVLTLRFGPPFQIEVPEDAPKRERDDLARRYLMSRIGALLPRQMWGPYTLDIEALLERSKHLA